MLNMKHTILFLLLSISVHAQKSDLNKQIIQIEDKEVREALNHCADDYNLNLKPAWTLFSVYITPIKDNGLELFVKGFFPKDTTTFRVPDNYILLDNTVFFIYSGDSLNSSHQDKEFEQHIKDLHRDRINHYNEEIRKRQKASIANEKYRKSVLDSITSANREKNRLKIKTPDATKKDDWANVGAVEIRTTHTPQAPTYRLIYSDNKIKLFRIQQLW